MMKENSKQYLHEKCGSDNGKVLIGTKQDISCRLDSS